MEDRQIAVIIARPSRLRDGLEALIAAMPQIAAITIADDCVDALRMVADMCPALIFLDVAACDGDYVAAVATLKAASPETRCVVLADSLDELRRAHGTDADCVLLKGISGIRLFDVVGRLLSPSTGNISRTDSISRELPGY